MATAADAGDWHVVGQLSEASNATFLVEIHGRRHVYKPVRGERPLWDFPEGTLGRREVAAYEVSRLLGWDLVPKTRWATDGPFGAGSLQDWVEATGLPVSVFPGEEVPEGWLPVISAVDEEDRPLEVAHRDTDDLRRMAMFDLLVNNADRKGSHIFELADGSIKGIDQGLCFHDEPKLRTVLWGFVGQPLPDLLCSDLAAAADRLPDAMTGLGDGEIAAVLGRAGRLLEDRLFPPPAGGPVIPWPPI